MYGAGNSVFNVGLLFVFGLILAPMAEQSMRQALTISMGDWSTFVTRPLSASLLAVAAVLVVTPPVYRMLKRS